MDDTLWCMPILHPAYILRGNFELEPFQSTYLRRGLKILEEGGWEGPLDPEVPPKGSILYPTLENMKEWESGLDVQGCSVDIETAGPHITIVGLCRLADLRPIVLRFRAKGGHVWDQSATDLERKLEWLFRILADPAIPLWFHNGQAFDIPILEEAGFTVNGYFDVGGDTLLLQHCCYPEAPKRLEFVANCYVGTPNWKYLSGTDSEGEGK